ncbi:MAG TPA: type II secretion system protein [Verrucomicrobiota bacterium]|nr:type II secretion system protein [Verrucomicrobiota bacterium]
MKIKSTLRAGFTLVEIMIVVAIIGLLAAIAVPNFVKARTTAQKNACINNLRQIDGAIQQWALETKQGNTAPVNFTEVLTYLKNEVKCPSAGLSTTADACYEVSTVNAQPPVTCKIEPATHSLITLEAPPAPAE